MQHWEECIVFIFPSHCFNLGILLHRVRSLKYFQDLKTVAEIVKETHQAACQDRSLLENDNQC